MPFKLSMQQFKNDIKASILKRGIKTIELSYHRSETLIPGTVADI